jgi:hypothetical protein
MSERREEYATDATIEWGEDVITRTLQDVWNHLTTVQNADTAIRALMREEILKAIGVWVHCDDDGAEDAEKAKDVYEYENSGSKVTLCISCAVRRRLESVEVEMINDRPVMGRCVDCNSAEVTQESY